MNIIYNTKANVSNIYKTTYKHDLILDNKTKTIYAFGNTLANYTILTDIYNPSKDNIESSKNEALTSYGAYTLYTEINKKLQELEDSISEIDEGFKKYLPLAGGTMYSEAIISGNYRLGALNDYNDIRITANFYGDYLENKNDIWQVTTSSIWAIWRNGRSKFTNVQTTGALIGTNGLYITLNCLGISFRSELNSTWSSWIATETDGNEALVFGTLNTNTAFMFINGESYGNISNDRFKALTPALTILSNKVYIGYSYSSSHSSDASIFNVDGNGYISSNFTIAKAASVGTDLNVENSAVIKGTTTSTRYFANKSSDSWIGGMSNAALNANYTGYGSILSAPVSDGRISIGTYPSLSSESANNFIYISYATLANIDANNNATTNWIKLLPHTGDIYCRALRNNEVHADRYYLNSLSTNYANDSTFRAVIGANGEYFKVAYNTNVNGTIPYIGGDSVLEVGKYIDFHNVNNESLDYSTRLFVDGQYRNQVALPTTSGRLITTTDITSTVNNLQGYVQTTTIIDCHNLDNNTYYPVAFNLASNNNLNNSRNIRLECRVALDMTYTNSDGISVICKPKWAYHANGFSVGIIWESVACGWGTLPVNQRVYDYSFRFIKLHNNNYPVASDNTSQYASDEYDLCPVRGLTYSNTSNSDVIYVRGGGIYKFYCTHHVEGQLYKEGYDPHANDSYAGKEIFPIVKTTLEDLWNGLYNADATDALKKIALLLKEITPSLGYWANIPVSTVSSVSTAPQFASLQAGSIYLHHTNEINSLTTPLYILYRGVIDGKDATSNAYNTIINAIHGNVGIGTSSPTYKLDVSGITRTSTLYSNYIDSPDGGYMKVALKAYKFCIDPLGDKSSGYNANPAFYIKDYVSTNRITIVNLGFGIRPLYIDKQDYNYASITISGTTYNYIKIETSTRQTISCLFVDKPYMTTLPTLIDLYPGADGLILFLKDLQNYGNPSNAGKFYIRPVACNIIRGNNSNILISSGRISSVYDDELSRFLIYSEKYSIWIEFCCSS